MSLVQLVAGLLLLIPSWIGLRRTVRARFRAGTLRLHLLDVAPIVLCWVAFVSLSGRPVFAAVIVAALAFGLSRGDRAKRAATGEPLVFTDGVLGSIFLYPSLYAEFVTPPVLVAAASSTVGLFIVVGMIEPPLWQGAWPGPVLCAALALALVFGASRTLRWLGQTPAHLPLGDVKRDSAQFGPLATVFIHHAAAARQREVLRSRVRPGCSEMLPHFGRPNGPVVLLQLESFFDARRMGAFVPADLLPAYDRCVAGSIRHGRLLTPAFGANTVRTEFAALTGLPDEAIGLDRFNAYAAFARVPIDSLAWRMKAAGYRTVCLHPFAGRFYGRSQVMPNLGFDSFIDIAGFDVPEAGTGYVPDTVVVERIAQILRTHGRNTFVFAITMGNHSPWRRPRQPLATDLPQGEAFGAFLEGLRRTDEAVGNMADILRTEWRDGLLAAFGDHQPSFRHLRKHLAFDDRRTDYFFYRPDQAFGQRCDVAAHDLPGLVLRDAADHSSVRARLALSAGL